MNLDLNTIESLWRILSDKVLTKKPTIVRAVGKPGREGGPQSHQSSLSVLLNTVLVAWCAPYKKYLKY